METFFVNTLFYIKILSNQIIFAFPLNNIKEKLDEKIITFSWYVLLGLFEITTELLFKAFSLQIFFYFFNDLSC